MGNSVNGGSPTCERVSTIQLYTADRSQPNDRVGVKRS
jgi:hypothetical protein